MIFQINNEQNLLLFVIKMCTEYERKLVMSDEKEIKDENQKCCCCISKEYKQFLATLLAAFLGCLVALCVYSNALKPQMPPCPCGCSYGHGCPIHKMHQKFDKPHKHFKGEHKQFKGEKPPVKPEK